MNPIIIYSENSLYLTFITFLGSFLIWFMFAGLIFLWVIDGRIKKEVVLHALTACLISWLMVLVIKSLLPHARPFEVNGRLPLTFTIPTPETSFPSAHSTVAFAIAASIWLHKKKLGIWFIALAILVAMGRVATNVHYMIDVVSGGFVGVGTAYLVKKLHVFKLLG